MAYGQTDPGYGGGHGAAVQQPIADAYSTAPGVPVNRAAQAGGVAAHHNEDNQTLQGNGAATKNMRDDDVRKLVAEENASRSKFPKYPGLERYELLEKMGDGAFSNVYRARDLEGDAGEVGIKVVRKFEMNSMQVSRRACARIILLNLLLPFCAMALRRALFSFCNSSEFLYQRGGRSTTI